MLRTSKRRGGRSYLRGNRGPIIPRTLGVSVITCVSVYLGMPRGVPRQILRTGARNSLRLTITTNTHLLDGTVSATQEPAADTRDSEVYSWVYHTDYGNNQSGIPPTIPNCRPQPRRAGYIRTFIPHHVFSSSRSISHCYLVTTYSTLHFTVHLQDNPTYK
jgi:hypothetical protein